MNDQLTLNMQLRDDASLDSYYPGDNAQILRAMQQFVEGVGEKFLYLWGKEGVGRSHLLQAVCLAARNKGEAVAYVPLCNSEKLSPKLVQGLENIPIVCIDDIQCIAKINEWEEALFHLYNRVRAQNTALLIAGNAAPGSLDIQLPDLKSRLAWGVTYQVQPLSDEQKLFALALRAKCRGLQLKPAVGQFLLSHCPRNMVELFNTLEILDKASLAEQRHLTIPFVKQVLMRHKIIH